ncbi:LOW QUALITY PROTEIN: peroxidase 44-like [Magnolia sinica]|uniref:LOW QUALITY PROTEIN: peroxidase 44-like n=1 Tax=Magnolia sinica TaxID=86752 RepID=UPI00265967A1|nr:LOW QUALITY PROTEIN: peroxidase 44-like [Magnolia sinica]
MKMFLFLLFLSFLSIVLADIRVGFYTPRAHNSTCPQAESIIKGVVQKHFTTYPSITAAFLRMHFHDCLVRIKIFGCDASILIDSNKKKTSEKAAGPNLTVRGFEIIDEAKKSLEKQCPSTVSCADIITIATRDAVAFSGGPKYLVPTGRRDGLVSNVSEVRLPGPASSISQALQDFTAKGLTLNDMVILLGAHTVGVAHCGFFQYRLLNFNGTGKPDPSMDSNLVAQLTKTCGKKSRPLKKEPTAFLDQNTSFVINNQYYNQLVLKRGILQIDQELTLDRSTAGIASSFGSDGAGFLENFADAMVKLGSFQVLVGNAGEIRKNCGAFN